MQQGGVAVYEGIVDDNNRNVLLVEVVSLSVKAVQCNVAISDHEELRGGVPARRFLWRRSARRILQSAWLLDFLREIAHPSLAPTGVLGT
jgi:hypothetical protein